METSGIHGTIGTHGIKMAINANPGLKFNRLFILVSSVLEHKFKLPKVGHFNNSLLNRLFNNRAPINQ